MPRFDKKRQNLEKTVIRSEHFPVFLSRNLGAFAMCFTNAFELSYSWEQYEWVSQGRENLGPILTKPIVFLLQKLFDQSLKPSHTNWHFSIAGRILLHKICAVSSACKYTFRASDGVNGDCSPEHLSSLFDATTLHSFPECDLTFEIHIKSLGTCRDLSKLSTESKHPPALCQRRNAFCEAAGSAACAALKHWAWVARKNVELKISICTWKRMTKL